jgi:hypothetical protein
MKILVMLVMISESVDKRLTLLLDVSSFSLEAGIKRLTVDKHIPSDYTHAGSLG